MSRQHYGLCRLCHERAKMTFEHVPPRSTFNSNPMRQYDGNMVLENIEAYQNGKMRYRPAQKGSGGYYLCESCNSKTGGRYVSKYEIIVNDIASKFNFNNKKYFDAYARYQHGSYWGDFFREIMVMFLDVSKVCSDDYRLRKYLQTPNSTDFNYDRYKVFMYVTQCTIDYKTKIICDAKIVDSSIRFAEISSFPVGYLLLIDKNNKMLKRRDLMRFQSVGEDITRFAKIRSGQKTNELISLPVHNIDSEEPIIGIINDCSVTDDLAKRCLEIITQEI